MTVSFEHPHTACALCKQCGVPFTSNDLKRKHCSPECAAESKRAHRCRRQTAHRERYPLRIFARQYLKNAVLLGKVRRPARCERCGDVSAVNGHHADYTRPLYVEWLCDECHAGLDDGRHFGAGQFKPDEMVSEQGVSVHAANDSREVRS